MVESLFELTSSSSSTPADCRYGIELTEAISHYDVPARAQSWRMRIWVSDWYNVDPNLFLFQRGDPDPITGDVSDTFLGVCTPSDIEEYPAGAPRPDQEPPFYRLAEVDLISRNQQMLAEAWRLIKADRDELIRTYVGICELDVNEVSREGEFPDDVPPTPPVPPVPPEPSSSSSGCPADAYTSLKVTASNDPDFPVDTVLIEDGTEGDLPRCLRQWTADGIVSDKTLVVTTSMTYHTYVFVLDGVELATGGLADGYKAIVNYTRDLGEDFTLELAGVYVVSV